MTEDSIKGGVCKDTQDQPERPTKRFCGFMCFLRIRGWFHRIRLKLINKLTSRLQKVKTHRCKNNAVHTSKYTFFSFIPKCLFYQFSRFSNIYFLTVGVMQLFPVISDSGGIPTTLVPLSIVICVSSLKDLIEDLRRHRSDAEENNRPVKVCFKGEVIEKRWQDLHVGDIVKLERNNPIPADLILLGSSGEFGVSYVETKSLDGETNLKHKVAIPEIAQFFTCDKDASSNEVKVTCGPPLDTLYEFQGSIDYVTGLCSKDHLCLHEQKNSLSDVTTQHLYPHSLSDNSEMAHIHKTQLIDRIPDSLSLDSNPMNTDTIQTSSTDCYITHKKDITFEHTLDHRHVLIKGPFSVGLGQFFLRGSSLINTTWAYGVVVYVSRDTRIFQNANTRATFKWSHLEKTYNRHVLVLVIFEIFFCLAICIGAVLFPRSQWYLAWPQQLRTASNGDVFLDVSGALSITETITLFFTVFGSMIILFAYFVPIDLFLTLEIVRLAQGCFVSWDLDMRLVDENIRASSQSSHLLEELGNTTHVYTDKTGTLTKNLMVLRHLSFQDCPIAFPGDKELLSSESFSGPDKSFQSFIESIDSLHQQCSTFENHKTSHSHSSCSVPCRPITLNITNDFCSVKLMDIEKAVNSITDSLVAENIRSFLLSLGVCHTVLIRDVNISHDLSDFDTAQFNNNFFGTLPTYITPCKTTLQRDSYQEEWTVFQPPLAVYDASSPDELSLVSTAQTLGVEFFCRNRLDRVQLRLLTQFAQTLILGQHLFSMWNQWVLENPIDSIETDTTKIIWVPIIEFELLDVLEFDNERKRMSVIIRDYVSASSVINTQESLINDTVLQNQIYSSRIKQSNIPTYIRLLTKGADANVIDIASSHQAAASKRLMTRVNTYARSGLRTLAFGSRLLLEKEYQIFHQQLVASRTAAFAPGKLEVLVETPLTYSEVLQSIEKNLLLTGCTGVEDKLQDDVPNVIRELRTCGIRFWLLTGDKPETAINISFSAHLLTDTTYNCIIDGTTRKSLEEQLGSLRRHCENSGLLLNKTNKKLNKKLSSNIIQQSSSMSLNNQESNELFKHNSNLNKHIKTMKSACLSKSKLCVTPAQRCCGPILSSASLGTSRMDSEEFLTTLFVHSNELLFEDCVPDDSFSQPLTPKKSSATNEPFITKGSSFLKPINQNENDFNKKDTIMHPNGMHHSVVIDDSQHPALSSTIDNLETLTNNDTQMNHFLDTQTDLFLETPNEELYNDKLKYVDHLTIPSSSILSSPDVCIPSPVPEKQFKEFAITITGSALNIILKRKALMCSFYRLTRHASVVIACRVTPKQKACLVTQSTALNPECISSLAIGDGANDVAMILSADVGVGISGKEGLQATRAADFGIAEFRFLRKLLLVHGREALRRNSFLIYYGIFKNIAFCVASFSYQFICGFSGQDIYNFWLKSLYATLFVAPTVILYAIFDRELPHYILHRSPITYRCLAPVMWPFSDSSTVASLSRCYRWMMRKLFKCFYTTFYNSSSNQILLDKKLMMEESTSNIRLEHRRLKLNQLHHSKQRSCKTSIHSCCAMSCRLRQLVYWIFCCCYCCYCCCHTKNNKRSTRCCCFKGKSTFRTVPGVKSYGTRLLHIWFIYAVFVGVLITLLPLRVLNNATSVDRRTFRRQMDAVGAQIPLSYLYTYLHNTSSVREFFSHTLLNNQQPSFVSFPKFVLNKQQDLTMRRYDDKHRQLSDKIYNAVKTSASITHDSVPPRDEGKSGFDLPLVGMVVLFQCILICNLIVTLAINSLFWFQACVMIGNLLLFIALWAMTSWPAFVIHAVPGLQSVWGSFGTILKCTAYYFCVFLSIFFSIIPIFSAKVFKVMFEPNCVTIIKERMLQGVFDVVIGRRPHGNQEMVVFVPQRHQLPPLHHRHDSSMSQMRINEKYHPYTECHTSLQGETQQSSLPEITRVQRIPSTNYLQTGASQGGINTITTTWKKKRFSVNSFNHAPTMAEEYTGFAFGYEDTVISSPPSVWILASVASWATRTVGTPLIQMSKGVGTRILGVGTTLLPNSSPSNETPENVPISTRQKNDILETVGEHQE